MGKCGCYIFIVHFEQVIKRGIFRHRGPLRSLQNVKDICGGVLY